jgi:hypothetical protein
LEIIMPTKKSQVAVSSAPKKRRAKSIKILVGEESPAELPDLLVVIEGTLFVDTNDDFLAQTAYRGFQYLLTREFMRQQPALSLLYDLDFSIIKIRTGSRYFDFKIIVKLKRRIRNTYKKASAAEIAGLIMGTPAAIVGGYELHDRMFPPVQQCLKEDLPQVEIRIEGIAFRAADGRDTPPKGGRVFDL